MTVAVAVFADLLLVSTWQQSCAVQQTSQGVPHAIRGCPRVQGARCGATVERGEGGRGQFFVKMERMRLLSSVCLHDFRQLHSVSVVPVHYCMEGSCIF